MLGTIIGTLSADQAMLVADVVALEEALIYHARKAHAHLVSNRVHDSIHSFVHNILYVLEV